MRQTGAARIAESRIEVEAKGLSFDQHYRTVREGAHAQLGPLQVGEDGERPAEILFKLTQQCEAGPVVGGAAVAEVEAKDVDAGDEQRSHRLAVGAGGAERRDDLGVSGSSHVMSDR